jgi:hypothetical protein
MMYAISFLILAYTWDPALAALFTPPHPRAGHYEVCTTDQPIDLLSDGAAIEALEPLDAFGSAGPYNRAALAQLYGGVSVRVVRRWHQGPNRFDSETLLSPYPDATLTRLVRGTMVIRFTIDGR